MSGQRGRFWLTMVMGKLCLFFYLQTFLFLIVFLLGNYQEFLDETQNMLLSLMSLSSFLAAATSLYYAIALVFFMISHRRTRILRFILAVLASTLGFIFSFGISFILSWLSPLS